MTTEESLLAAIWAEPHDDTPRLAYADWLQEHDQPERAEFIRAQCAVAPLDEWDERYPALEKRQAALLKKFGAAWRKGLPRPVADEPFRRGFLAPAQRRATTTKFGRLSAAALAPAPAWDYYLDGTADALLTLAASPNLLRLEKLRLWYPTTPETADALLRSPHLRNVAWLSLGRCDGWAARIAALAENDRAASLTELDIDEGLTDAAAAVVAGSPAFAKLRGFSAYRHKLTADGVRAIFASPHLSGLTELELPAWYGEAGAQAIAESRPAFRLRKLSLYGTRMTDAGAAMIARWPGLESVRSLQINGHCEVLGPQALASSPFARNLRELDLGQSRLSRRGAMALAKSKTLDLKRLLIRMTPAADDDEAVAALQKRFGKDAVKARYPGQRRRR